MDSDCDDVFTDESPKGTPVPDDDGCHLINRKRRRGIIEKRRRDRINNSLSELRRLVPAAFEKQGSAKLEKAEILQMTVDHLKITHSKGMDMFNFDPQKFSMDYHGIGFRECASEVARYLIGMEGMDLQDPLKMRLMSHLQCFAAQRDLAIKSAMFSSLPATPTPQYPPVPPPVLSPMSDSPSILSSTGSSFSSCSESRRSLHSSSSSVLSTDSGSTASSPTSLSHLPRVPVVSTIPPASAPISFPNSSSHTAIGSTYSQVNASNNSSYLGGHSFSSFSGSPTQPSPVRPYRPWGAELAY